MDPIRCDYHQVSADDVVMSPDVPANGASPFAPPVPTFLFESRPVRVLDLSGDPWFVATDVCSVLGIANSRDAVSRLDDDEKGVGEIDTLGGRQSVSIVSEPGLYALVGRSNKPDAKRFDRWVRHDVLPTIRKTGRYGVAVPDLSNPNVLKSLLLQTLDTTIRLEGQVAGLKPKAEALDRLADTDGMILISDAAKQLQMPIKDLFEWLRSHGWIFRRRGSTRDIGYADKIAAGLLVHKYYRVPQEVGRDIFKERVLLTPKGVAHLAVLFAREVGR
jgi:prophage antirepressor-like protein